MRTISFHKKAPTAICKFCGVGSVPLTKANRRCDFCRGKEDEVPEKSGGVVIGKRVPAAIIQPEGTSSEVYVDKFGQELENPGYDTKQDARGWGYTGTQKKDRTLT